MYDATHDIDKSIMLEALADRLAEAFAELIHHKIRTDPDFWGYVPEEKLTLSDMLKVNLRRACQCGGLWRVGFR